MSDASPLNGKVAWVTGGGSGIGAATALALASAGAAVVLTGRRPEPLQRVASEIESRGGRARVDPGDLLDPETSRRIVAEVEAREGRLDILVNNAGTNIPDRDWGRLTGQAAAGLIDGNLTCAFFAVIAVLPIMRRQWDGIIINTGSTAGRYVTAQPGPAYTAAKHGIVAMSHSINVEEVQNGIRSTVLNPGDVATPIVEKRPNETSAQDLQLMLKSEDVADIALYIATRPPQVLIEELTVRPTRFRPAG